VADPLDIARLRRLIGEPVDTEPWNDAALSQIIDDAADLNSAALEVWEAKAASSAAFVDTTESGSSRKMSQLNEQALKMVAHFKGLTDTPVLPPDLSGYAYTVPIERV
jgi:hypothetical protein